MLKAGAELAFSPSSRTRVQEVTELRNNPFARNGVRYDPFNPRPKPWEFGGVHDPNGLLPTPWDTDPQEEPDPTDKFFDD